MQLVTWVESHQRVMGIESQMRSMTRLMFDESWLDLRLIYSSDFRMDWNRFGEYQSSPREVWAVGPKWIALHKYERSHGLSMDWTDSSKTDPWSWTGPIRIDPIGTHSKNCPNSVHACRYLEKRTLTIFFNQFRKTLNEALVFLYWIALWFLPRMFLFCYVVWWCCGWLLTGTHNNETGDISISFLHKFNLTFILDFLSFNVILKTRKRKVFCSWRSGGYADGSAAKYDQCLGPFNSFVTEPGGLANQPMFWLFIVDTTSQVSQKIFFIALNVRSFGWHKPFFKILNRKKEKSFDYIRITLPYRVPYPVP